MQGLIQYQSDGPVSEQEQISVRGGEYDAIFKRLEKVLLGDWVLYKEAIEFVEYGKTGKSIDDYKTVVDFLFCELVYTFRPSCFRYYEKEGVSLPQMLRNHTSLVRTFEHLLLRALSIMLQMMSEESGGWDEFLKRFLSSLPLEDESEPVFQLEN